MINLNSELYMVFIPPISAMLFALGGTQISTKIKGQKWIRRFVLPVFFGVSVLLAGFSWLQAAGVCGLSIGCFCLGYGSGKTWTYRFMVGCSYALITLPIGFSFWNLMTPMVFIVFFILSNWDYSSDEFPWKLCELMFGLSCGIQLAYLLM